MESANSEDGLYLHLSHSREGLYPRPSGIILCGVVHWTCFRVEGQITSVWRQILPVKHAFGYF